MAADNIEVVKRALTSLNNMPEWDRARAEAEQVLDEFKKNPVRPSRGLRLADKANATSHRVFGLQVVEYAVKNYWRSMSSTEKILLRADVMNMVSIGTKHILLEHSDIKDAYARIVMEIIKYDWPDNWPKLLSELDAISKKQETQAELVLLILMRLAEVVATSQKEPFPRGPELQRALVLNMKEILNLTAALFIKNVKRYNSLKGDRSQAKSSSLIVTAALNTLAGYIGWLGMWHVANEDYKLLEMIWLLLNEPEEIQLAAANCLLVAINRMEKLKSCDALMVLFGNDAMHHILSAAKKSAVEERTAKHMNLLKKICLIVCAMGRVLCSVMGSDIPANFGKYLDSLLEFTEQSSQWMHFSTQSTWRALFNHEVLSRHPKLMAILPNYLSTTMTNLEKVGLRVKTDGADAANPSHYLVTDDDFNATFTTIYDQQREMIQLACRVDPVVCLQMASGCLKYQMTYSEDHEPTKSETSEDPSSVPSHSVVRWEAMTFFFENVISQIFKVMGKEEIPVKDVLELILHAMRFETKDTFISSCVAKNVSAIFHSVSETNECLPQVLSLLFEMIEVIKDPKEQFTNTLRRYAFASIIKQCQDNGSFLLPHFEVLFSHVKQLLSNELQLTGMEKRILTKGLVLVSNHFKNYELQKTFLQDLLAPVATLWLSSVMQWLLTDAVAFIPHVGANLKITDIDLESPTELYRSRISYCVTSILEVLKSTQLPTDLEEAKAGGFVTGYMPDGNPIYRNPCTEQVIKLLDSVFDLIRIQHTIFLPEMLDTISDSLVLKPLNVDKTSASDPQQPLLDLYNPPVYDTGLERMQDYFRILYEDCFSILWQVVLSLKELYSVEDLFGRIVDFAFFNLENVPCYRLLSMLRTFVKPLVIFSPPEYYESLVIPVLGPYLTAIHMRLTNEWHLIGQKHTLNKDTTTDANHETQEGVKENTIGENPDSTEIVDETQVRLLTQEIIQFIDNCCFSSAAADTSDAVAKSNDDAMDLDPLPEKSTVLTEVAVCLLKEEVARSAVLVTAFASLGWKDGLTSYTSATRLCWPLLKHVMSEPLFPDAVTYLFTMVLKGLQVHPSDSICIDALVHLAFQIYIALRPRYEDLKAVMLKIPNIKKFYFWVFDKKLISTVPWAHGHVDRKMSFTNLIKGCIGKPLCEKEHIEANISDSPPAVKKRKTIPSPSFEPVNFPLPSVEAPYLPPPSVGAPNLPPPSTGLTNLPPPSVEPTHFPPPSVGLTIVALPPVKPTHFPLPSLGPTNFPLPSLGSKNFPPPSLGPTNFPPPSGGPSNFPPPSVGLTNFPLPSVEPTNFPSSFLNPNNFPPPSGNTEHLPPSFSEPSNCSPPFSNLQNHPPNFREANSFPPPFSNPQHPSPHFTGPNHFPAPLHKTLLPLPQFR